MKKIDAYMDGDERLEYYMKTFGDLPNHELDWAKTLRPVNNVWKNKPKSNIVKQLMKKSGKTTEEIAQCLGCSEAYLNNKLQRESFSLDDIIIVAYVCGYILNFVDNNPDTDVHTLFQINVQDYLKVRNKEALVRLYDHLDYEKKKKKEEYDQLKEKLNKLKMEYGFED